MDKLGKIHLLRRKERLQINKISKFEGDLLKTNEDIPPQSREISLTFVAHNVAAQTCPPPNPPPPPYKRL